MLPQRISNLHSKVCQIHAQLHQYQQQQQQQQSDLLPADNGNTNNKAAAIVDGNVDVESGRTDVTNVSGNTSNHQQPHLPQSLGRLTAKLLNNNNSNYNKNGRNKWNKKGGGNSLCCCLRKQLFCAQCLKLLALFTIAITHLLFLHPFLELFSQLDEYATQVDIATTTTGAAASVVHVQESTTAAASPFLAINLLRLTVHEFAEYKKNIWMTVAVLCVALSTSAFFLFLLPATTVVGSPPSIRKRYVYLVGLVDAISFGCLPPLFSARISIVQLVHEQLGRALEQAHKISSAEKLMNEAQCSIQPREKLPFCSELIMRSVFPVDLLKFLFVLCVMTMAYLLVAYIIYWCIKHWIPHNQQRRCYSQAGKFCHCCRAISSSPSSWHGSPLPLPKNAFFSDFNAIGDINNAGSYVPLNQSEKGGIFVGCSPPSLIVPNPLMAVPSPPSQCSPSLSLSGGGGDEQIPTEPTPKQK